MCKMLSNFSVLNLLMMRGLINDLKVKIYGYYYEGAFGLSTVKD